MKNQKHNPPTTQFEAPPPEKIAGGFQQAGVKKMKENCFALLAEFRRTETRSGAIQAFSVQKMFERRSAIATDYFQDEGP